jgi:hypothetical protein
LGPSDEAISTIRRLEIAAATYCGLAMTIAEVPGSKNEHSGTKNRLPENPGRPGHAESERNKCKSQTYVV